MAPIRRFEAMSGGSTYKVFVDEKRLVAAEVANEYDGLVADAAARGVARSFGLIGAVVHEFVRSEGGGAGRKREKREKALEGLTMQELASDPDHIQLPSWAIVGASLSKDPGGVARLTLQRKRGDVLRLVLPTLHDYYACRALLEKPLAGRVQVEPGLRPVARPTS